MDNSIYKDMLVLIITDIIKDSTEPIEPLFNEKEFIQFIGEKIYGYGDPHLKEKFKLSKSAGFKSGEMLRKINEIIKLKEEIKQIFIKEFFDNLI